MTFNIKKQWAYLLFMLPYLLFSLITLVNSKAATALSLSKSAFENFEIYRFVTMFFYDTDIISIIFTLYLVYVFFDFLSHLMTQVKIVALHSISIILCSILFYVSPFFSVQKGIQLSASFFAVSFLITLGVALLLYKEEMMARIFLSRMWFVIFIQVYMLTRSGSESLFFNGLIVLSVTVVLLGNYYFTEPKQGYML